MKVEIFDKFESYLLKLDEEDKESIIMGDTNCNLLSHTFDHITETYQHIQLNRSTNENLIPLALEH